MLQGNQIDLLHKTLREEKVFFKRIEIQFKQIRNLYLDVLRQKIYKLQQSEEEDRKLRKEKVRIEN